MATATPTRTLADVYRERYDALNPSDELYSAINAAISDMAPYHSGDLRPSEETWIDELSADALDAAKLAIFEAVAKVMGPQIRRLLPSVEDVQVPVDLWVHGPDELREDSELAVSGE